MSSLDSYTNILSPRVHGRGTRSDQPFASTSLSKSVVPTARSAQSVTAKSAGQNSYQTRLPLVVMPLESPLTTPLLGGHGRAIITPMIAPKMVIPNKKVTVSVRGLMTMLKTKTRERKKKLMTMKMNGGPHVYCPRGSMRLCFRGLLRTETALIVMGTMRRSET